MLQPSMLARVAVALATTTSIAMSPAVSEAQGGHAHGKPAGPPDHASDAVHGAMAGRLNESLHMRMTPVRTASAADSARARRITAELRRALAKYADPTVAEADGFRLFLPGVKEQRVFHYTKWGHAARAQFRFDPARPTSLLYRKGADGRMVLVGGMYTAPRSATMAELDARVPLGIARWHLHTDFCLPERGEERRWSETRGGAPLFGPASPIATKEACDAVGGRFMPTVFNWMVHANVFDGDDLATVWGDGHHAGGEHGH